MDDPWETKWGIIPISPWEIPSIPCSDFDTIDDVVLVRGLFTREGKKNKWGGVHCLREKLEEAKDLLLEKVERAWELEEVV